jgi:hypothetical protein
VQGERQALDVFEPGEVAEQALEEVSDVGRSAFAGDDGPGAGAEFEVDGFKEVDAGLALVVFEIEDCHGPASGSRTLGTHRYTLRSQEAQSSLMR